jgi:hypothetical protein
MDIVITRDNFRALADVVIIDPTCIDLVQCDSTTTSHVGIVVAQDKA